MFTAKPGGSAYTTGHAGKRGAPSGQAGTCPVVGGCACACASCSCVRCGRAHLLGRHSALRNRCAGTSLLSCAQAWELRAA
eukprot:2074614-Prymnesium_polylepis.1